MSDTAILPKTVGQTPSAERISGSEIVIRALLAEGVQTIFGYPGGAIMPIYDALFDYQEQLHHVLVRHEQGGIHAAQGFARFPEKTGGCVCHQRSRRHQSGNRIGRCYDRFHAGGLYYRAGFCAPARDGCFSGN